MSKFFKPLEHQHLAVDHLRNNDIALLFAGMGLGKTAATLEAFSRRFIDCDSRGLLIVAPLRVAVFTWPDEVQKWSNFSWMRVANLRTKAGLQAWKDGSAQIYCINYESLPKFARENIEKVNATDLPVDAIMFDEIDTAKNPGSKRINYFRRVGIKKFKIRQGMTGTPVPNSHLDLFAQVRLLDQGERFGGQFGHFQRQYFEVENIHADNPKYVLREGSKGLIEDKISDITLTLLSKDWLKIPPVTVTDIEVKLPSEARKIYDKLQKKLIFLLASGDKLKAVNLAVLAGKLLQITGGACYKTDEFDEPTKEIELLHTAKIEALRKLHNEQENEPMLIACQYRHEIQRIKDELGAVEFSDEVLRKWNKGEVPLMVAHPRSIGHGLNLQDGGSRVVWFSLSYSRASYDQFNARLARTGQTHETQIFRLIISGTIDDAVAGVLESKGENQSNFLDTLVNIQRLHDRKGQIIELDIQGIEDFEDGLT
ncbi:DEAD/DEAH box helicase [Akkermansiaceae bacterium]|nr:DEAD/DEAH box helicase [Akkermansiaceae bacterium]